MDAEQLLRRNPVPCLNQSGGRSAITFDTDTTAMCAACMKTTGHPSRAITAPTSLSCNYQPKVNMRAPAGGVRGPDPLGTTPAWPFPARQFSAFAARRCWRWSWATGCQKTPWRRCKPGKHRGLHPVSVNVDGLHLQQPNFVPQAANLLASHPLVQPDPAGGAEQRPGRHRDRLRRDAGPAARWVSEFALDDLAPAVPRSPTCGGLPASVLKIDSSFVRDLDDPSDMAFWKACWAWPAHFAQVIAGRGNHRPRRVLLRLGCEWGQGHAIARAMPAADLKQWLNGVMPAAPADLNAVSSQGFCRCLSAVAEHRAWVNQLTAYLQGHTAEPPDTDAHNCHFGIWLNSETTLQRYHTSQRLAAIATLHGYMRPRPTS